jgi:hypothetical protein
LEVHWGTEVVVDGKEHDRFDWVGFAEAKRHCQPAELAGSFLAGCEASGFRRPRPTAVSPQKPIVSERIKLKSEPHGYPCKRSSSQL